MDMTSLEQRPQSQPPLVPRLTLQAAYHELTLATDPLRVGDLAQAILALINNTHGIQFQASLQMLLTVFSKAGIQLLPETLQLAQKIMSYFVTLSKSHKKQAHYETRYRLFFLASILAEMVRQKPQLDIPFSKDFLLQLLEIEGEQISQDARPRLLAILGVLYSNLSKQSRLVRDLKLGKRLKEALLANYSYIEQNFTLKLFNKCILDIQFKRIAAFSMQELERYGIKKALIKTIGEEKVQLIEKHMQRFFSISHN